MKTYKVLTSSLLCSLFSIVFFISCNDNDDFPNLVDSENPENTISTPCNFDLSTITANSTKVIDCVWDLKGETITLPESVKLDFGKGDIVNGKLVFTGDNNTIDGRLLNSKLEIEGAVKLKSSTFKFYTVRWDVVEGKTTKEISLTNRKNINKSIEMVKRLEGTVFELGKIDAYFNVEANKINRVYHSERSIRIPSDFHFKMNDDTFLRVQPTHFPSYSLLTTYVTDNSTISGGNLIGDRWEHNYSPINDIAGVKRDDHGYGFLIWIIGTHNSTVDNVTIKNASGDGIIIHSKTIRTPDGLLVNGNRTSEKITIKNSRIIESRRNGISVIDANGVIIDNCEVTDTGKGEQVYDANGSKIFSSSGTAPRYGIDLEALRYVNDNGTINEINKIENITIKRSKFKGNEAGDIVVYTASNVDILENYFDKWVGTFASNTVLIQKNTFEARDPNITFGINVNSYTRGGNELNHHFTITENTITGYRNGITLGGTNNAIYKNKTINCVTGLSLGDVSNSNVYENEYVSDLKVSYGINAFPNSIVENVNIEKEYIKVTNRPLNLRGINSTIKGETNLLTFDNCEFYTSSKNFKVHIKDSKNLTIKNSKMNTSIEKINSTNIIEEGNVVVD